MTSHQLTKREQLVIGSMLFGLFFGAGNLIFPVFVGQQAGSRLGPALLGFLLSGVGLPLLGVAAIGITKTAGVFELAKQVNRHYAFWFTLVLYVCIGGVCAAASGPDFVRDRAGESGGEPARNAGDACLLGAVFRHCLVVCAPAQ